MLPIQCMRLPLYLVSLVCFCVFFVIGAVFKIMQSFVHYNEHIFIYIKFYLKHTEQNQNYQ